VLFGFVVAGGTIPGESDTELVQAFIAIPGALIGLTLCWVYGSRTSPEGPQL
jgi:ABC-type sulfate transport system permease component